MAGKISVVLNTYNAGKYLRDVLSSALHFDEIVVCDMESTDNTIEIALKYGCRIVYFPKGNVSICKPARNTAIQAASNNWVLLIDADEVIPEALVAFLYRHIENDLDAPALDICRSNRFMGKPTKDGCDRQLRFFRKDRVFWPPTIHSRPVVEGPVMKLPAGRKDLFLIHLDNPSIFQRVEKLNNYSTWEVEKRSGKKYGVFAMSLRPVWAFARSFILRSGFRDGRRGLIRAQLNAFYQSLVIAKVFEWQESEKDSTPNIPPDSSDKILHKGRNCIWTDTYRGRLVAVNLFTPTVFYNLTHRFRPDKATQSLRNAQELVKRGFNTPMPIEAIVCRSALGFVRKAFYISEYDSNSISLAEAIDLYGVQAIKEFADFVVSLHLKGILHRDLNNTNVRVAVADNSLMRFSLIDLNRMDFTADSSPLNLKDSFENVTRFSCFDKTFDVFIDRYLETRGLDSGLKSEAVKTKLRHDRFYARKSQIKKLFHRR